jgi:uncharacterized membrane protein YozB (DUF420 family)
MTAAVESAATRRIIAGLTAVVCAAVAFVLYAFPGRTAPSSPGALPTVNAVLNGSAAVFLSIGYLMIRRRNVSAHRSCMLIAFGLSSAFLVTYLIHHAQVGSVRFEGTGWVRTLYFALLIPHVVLAAGVVPLALTTIVRGWTGRFVAHRRIARWTLPIWLFVSISGVALYFMLYHLPV